MNDNKNTNQRILQNLNKIKGQLVGIEKMISEKRDTIEIATQIQAIRAALSKVATDLIKDECKDCLDTRTVEERRKSFEDLVIKFFKIT